MDEEMDFQDLDDEDDLIIQAKGSSVPKSLVAPKYAHMQVSLPKRRVQGFSEIRNSEKKMEWVVQDLLPETGLLYWAGESASGKTILAIQTVIDIIMGRNTLRWTFNKKARKQKVLFLSLEMNSIELTQRFTDMYPKMSEDDDSYLQDHFVIYSDHEPFELWNTLHITELNHMMKTGEFTGLLIDSASVSFADQPNNAEQINKSIKNLFGMRAELGVWNGVIVHTKKPQGNDKRKPGDGTMHDIMGHSGFAQSASTILLLEPHTDTGKKNGAARKVEITNVKNRFGLDGVDHSFPALLPSKKSVVEDGIPLAFMTNVPHVLPPMPKQRPGEKKSSLSMTAGLEGIDLGSFMEDDEL